MNEAELIAQLREAVKGPVENYLGQQSMRNVVALDWMETLAQMLLAAMAVVLFEAWNVVLIQVARRIGLACPGCGHQRKCKTRPSQPMLVKLVGLEVSVPKVYLECSRCDAPGISITKVLTGLVSGSASAELQLRAAYLGATHSYGKAGRDLAVHYGQAVERTAVRRMALKVEGHAEQFAERSRQEALDEVSAEAAKQGPEKLMFQGDGGSVRTGRLQPCEPGDRGYGQKSPKRKQPRRKRVTQGREVITLDIREPGELEPSALDVVVPFASEQGERDRRMLALAARRGLGNNTEVIGLGDMGSALPAAFKEAFVGYKASYVTDWHHVCDYVHKASAVLDKLDVAHWRKQMRDAVWHRDVDRRDALLQQARAHRVQSLPPHLAKCPVRALATYLSNNWEHMRSKQLKDAGLDYVSARAEAQVRDRTRDRFSVAGAWCEHSLEGKATLRAIIDEGRWQAFRQDYLERSRCVFDQQLRARLQRAVKSGRLGADQAADFLASSVAAKPRDAAAAVDPVAPKRKAA